VLGVTFTKAFGFLTTVGYSVRILKGAEIVSLKLVAGLVDDINFIKEFKYRSMREHDLMQDHVAMAKEIDEQVLKSWKESVINKMIQVYPDSYRERLEYDDWSGALKYLEKLAKQKRI
jgi:methyl coenzyme M reductase subunit C-like uncharacterized protein (methanogenesis marker protein 7)